MEITRYSYPKLYYTSHSCSSSVFISAFTAGISIPCEQVDISKKITSSGQNFYDINPKGSAPALVFPNGILMNENAAILQAVLDMKPNSVIPPFGTMERYMVMNALNYIASEIHVCTGTNWFTTTTPDQKEFAQKMFDKKMNWLNAHLANRNTLFYVTNTFSVADAYLCVCLSWIKMPNINQNLDKYPYVKNYFNFVTSQPNWIAAQQLMEMNPNYTC
jgi:glutathione S-transferase